MPNRGAVAMMADARSVWPTVGGLRSRNRSVSATAKTPSLIATTRLGSFVNGRSSVRSMSSLPVLLIGILLGPGPALRETRSRYAPSALAAQQLDAQYGPVQLT